MGREMGGRFKREGTYLHLWLIHVDAWQKTTKFCTEREEGVAAIEVTWWLGLQDTSVKQEGGGSSNPWNSSGRAGAQEDGLQHKLQEYLVLLKVPHLFYIGNGKSRIHLEEKVKCWCKNVTRLRVSCSVVSNSLWPHVLYIAHQAPLSMAFSRQEYWSG